MHANFTGVRQELKIPTRCGNTVKYSLLLSQKEARKPRARYQ